MYVARALEEPIALGVATAIIAGAIRTTTRPAGPHGCLGVQGALATGDSGRAARDLLVAWCDNGYSRIRERFQRAVDDGDLPPEADPAVCALMAGRRAAHAPLRCQPVPRSCTVVFSRRVYQRSWWIAASRVRR